MIVLQAAIFSCNIISKLIKPCKHISLETCMASQFVKHISVLKIHQTLNTNCGKCKNSKVYSCRCGNPYQESAELTSATAALQRPPYKTITHVPAMEQLTSCDACLGSQAIDKCSHFFFYSALLRCCNKAGALQHKRVFSFFLIRQK